MTAEIVFAVGQQPQTFSFHLTAQGNPWRFLADKTAIVLVPLCDTRCRPVSAPPLFDRLEIRPCRWGCPDFSQTNPIEFAELKRRFLAGEFPPQDIPMPPRDKLEQYWPNFLNQLGEQMLWEQYATDDMKRHWINAFGEFTSPGSKLFNFAQSDPHQRRCAEPTILQSALGGIKFRADFCDGESRQTIYLADCKPELMTTYEKQLSPSFIAQEKERVRKQKELAVAETKNLAQKKKLAAAEAKQHAAEAKKNLPWHAEGFRIIYFYNGRGKKVDELTLTSVFRALCQILSEEPEQRAWFGKIEPLIGPRAKKIDEDEGRGTMAETLGRRRLRDLLKERQGRTLQKWKVLVIEPAGQKKFIKLSPPKLAK
jgi:hypothetical protein